VLACLIHIIIYAICALIVIFILEYVFAQFLPLPGQVIMLIRILVGFLVGLLILLYALSCFGILGDGGPGPFFRHYP
jgi:hypothetical protein